MDLWFSASQTQNTIHTVMAKHCFPGDHFYVAKGSGRVPLSQALSALVRGGKCLGAVVVVARAKRPLSTCWRVKADFASSDQIVV